jgi:hypothetical protein
VDKFKNIAAKIHRSFQRVSTDWHDIENVGGAGYRVHQKFDPYERSNEGKPLKWSKEMESEYEARVEKLRKQDEFSKSSKKEKEKVAKDALNHLYGAFNIEMGDDNFDDWKKDVKKWEDKVKKFKLSVPITKLRAMHGVPDNRYITQLRKEDIDKYATEEEKDYLYEAKLSKKERWAAKVKNRPAEIKKLEKRLSDLEARHKEEGFDKEEASDTMEGDEEASFSRMHIATTKKDLRTLRKIKKEDIDKYATEEEKKWLAEASRFGLHGKKRGRNSGLGRVTRPTLHDFWEADKKRKEREREQEKEKIKNKKESENQSHKVRHKKSGLIYRLYKNEEGYYLSSNDGLVPSGQQLYGTLERILQDYHLELVE